MAKSYTYSTRQIRKILKENGYTYVRTSGDHDIYSNGTHSIPITPKINKMLALRVLKQCGIPVR